MANKSGLSNIFIKREKKRTKRDDETKIDNNKVVKIYEDKRNFLAAKTG